MTAFDEKKGRTKFYQQGRGGRALIAKCNGTRKTFRGTVRYATHDVEKDGRRTTILETSERVEWTAGLNLPSDTPEIAEKVMAATARENSRVSQPAYHFTLDWAPGSAPTQEEQLEVTKGVLERVGLQDHQALVAAHNDTPHPHVHVVVNRVHPETGRAWDTGNDYSRFERAVAQEANARGYEVVIGHHNRRDFDRPPPERGPSGGHLRQLERHGQAPFADIVKEVAGHDFAEAESWRDLDQRLERHGLQLRKEGRGLVVTDGHEHAKASSIDRKASIHALEKRFGSYDEHRRAKPERQGGERHPGADRRDHRRDGHRPDPDRGTHRPGGRGHPVERGADRGAPMGRGAAAPLADPDHHPGADPGRDGGVDHGRGDGNRPGGTPSRDRGLSPDVPLGAAIERLDRWEALTARMEQAKAQAERHGKDAAALDHKAAWADKKAQQFREDLARIYRAPDAALEAFRRHADRDGIAQAARRMERTPEAFGRLHGAAIGPIANDARRQAVRQAVDVSSLGKTALTAERAARRMEPLRQEAHRLTQYAREQAIGLDRQRQEIGTQRGLIRDVADAARHAPADQRNQLSPHQRDQVQAAQHQAQIMDRMAQAPTPGRGGFDRSR